MKKQLNINIVAVGKLKEKFLKEALAEYEKRMSSYAKVTFIEVKEAIDDDVQKEGQDIISKLGEKQHIIALDVKGVQKSSESFSKTIANLGIEGKSNITFIIGGSKGLSKEVLDRADERLSFSKMTFTHQMMRVILLEQIYRAFKIIKNEPYHK